MHIIVAYPVELTKSVGLHWITCHKGFIDFFGDFWRQKSTLLAISSLENNHGLFVTFSCSSN